MEREKLGTYNVVAAFGSLDQARQALLDLERSGIEAANISVLGKGAENAEDISAHHTGAADTGIMGDTMKGAAIGGATGIAAGGIAGFLAGALAFAIPGVGPAIGTGIWLSTVGGAVLGGGLGGYWGILSNLPANPDADFTYEEAFQSGKVLVAVHSEDPAELEKARGVLKQAGPLRMDAHDAEGRPLGLSRGGSTDTGDFARS